MSARETMPHYHARAEVRVVLACVRCRDDELAEATRDDSLDWGAVLECAQMHGVLRFVASATARNAIFLPEPWKAILDVQHRRNVMRAMMQYRESDAIQRALASSDIRALPLKGTYLSKLLYGRVADRVSNDIDILVTEADFSRARAVLEKIGYAVSDDGEHLDTKTLMASGNEMSFRNGSGVVAEIHWRLFERDRVCGFRCRLEDLRFEAGEIEREDLFMILALHGLTHRWELLKWVVDIDAFVRNVNLRWDVLFTRAADSGTLRAVRIALFLTERLFCTPQPSQFVDESAQRLAERYERALLTGTRIRRSDDFWMQMLARERWIDRFRFARFVCTAKPWDHAASRTAKLSRVVRLLSRRGEAPATTAVQRIPELKRSAPSSTK